MLHFRFRGSCSGCLMEIKYIHGCTEIQSCQGWSKYPCFGQNILVMERSLIGPVARTRWPHSAPNLHLLASRKHLHHTTLATVTRLSLIGSKAPEHPSLHTLPASARPPGAVFPENFLGRFVAHRIPKNRARKFVRQTAPVRTRAQGQRPAERVLRHPSR